MQARFPFAFRLLPVIYLVFSFPVVLFQVFATPPFQVADEENHFMRTLQIADGHLIAHRLSETAAGGELDANAVDAAEAFNELKFHPERKLDMALYGQVAALQWGVAEKKAASFPNTAIYPPFFYLPASLGLDIGRLSGLSILDSFYLARLFTAVCATFLAGLAVAVCARGRSVLFVILSFPMVSSLFAGITQDGLSLASGAFVVAIWSHYTDRDEDIPLVIRCCAALLLGAIIGARIPLLPLFGLLLLPTSGGRRLFSRTWLSRDDLISLAVGLLPIVFGVVGASAAKMAFKPDLGVSPAGQMSFILHHPGADLRVALLTLQHYGADYLQQMVGVLGWLDTVLPPFYYPWIAFWLALALVAECLSPARSLGVWYRVAQCCVAVAGVAGVFGGLYLAWTPVGDAMVDGVQGRYLLVPAMFAMLALPTRPLRHTGTVENRRDRSATALAGARLLICGAVAAANLWIVPMTILHRYYGP